MQCEHKQQENQHQLNQWLNDPVTKGLRILAKEQMEIIITKMNVGVGNVQNPEYSAGYWAGAQHFLYYFLNPSAWLKSTGVENIEDLEKTDERQQC